VQAPNFEGSRLGLAAPDALPVEVAITAPTLTTMDRSECAAVSRFSNVQAVSVHSPTITVDDLTGNRA
jgi:hypothetical protein